MIVEANRKVYDNIAHIYDSVDRRRSGQQAHKWIDKILQREHARLSQNKTPSEIEQLKFLDAGTGSGFLAYKANQYFKNIVLVDVSQEILNRIDIANAERICSTCEQIPAADNSVDFIGAFATLHHLYSPEEFLQESHRLLKKSGILYTDHDIEYEFVKRFKGPLSIYRKFFDHGHDYIEQSGKITEQDYEMSEYHGHNGVNASSLIKKAQELGFEQLEVSYHWDGMGIIGKTINGLGVNRLLAGRSYSPILRLVLRKR